MAVYDMNTNKIKLANIFGNGGMIGRVDVTWLPGAPPGYQKFYYLKDHLGSTRVEFDRYATVSSAYSYYAYGQISQSYNNSNPNDKYKFTGKERDSETNYDYFGARYYDSELGRWMSVDPLASLLPHITPYNYCSNNPLNRIDPTGMEDSSIVHRIGPGKYQLNEVTAVAKRLGSDETYAIGGSGNSTEYHYPDRTEIRSGGTWTWRNNNPGNLVSGRFANRKGAIGSSGPFAVFPDYATGEEALYALISEIYGDFTISEMMYKYAPPTENNTEGYINFIVKSTGYESVKIINSLGQLGVRAVSNVIKRFEGFKVGNITIQK